MPAEYPPNTPPLQTCLHVDLDVYHARNPGRSERLCQVILLAPALGTDF